MFPEGIFYDRKSDEVRTTRVNTLFELTKRISDIHEAMKKGHFYDFDEMSLNAGMKGSGSNFLMEDLERMEKYFELSN